MNFDIQYIIKLHNLEAFWGKFQSGHLNFKIVVKNTVKSLAKTMVVTNHDSDLTTFR